MANHKHSVHITARPQDHPFLRSCMLDQSLRVMVLCAAGNTGVQDIVFPHQSELKVNGGEVKANLRGLKNKPGSTKPADITNYLRLKPPSYPNNIEFTYALTSSVSHMSMRDCPYEASYKLLMRVLLRLGINAS